MSARPGTSSTVELGSQGEQMAAEYLIAQGYRIATRNFRVAGGEVDLIAYEGEVLCFVEVRSRHDDAYGDPLDTIDPPKRHRIAHAAREYIHTLARPWPEMRFDAVGIVLEPLRITLVRDAFELTRVW